MGYYGWLKICFLQYYYLVKSCLIPSVIDAFGVLTLGITTARIILAFAAIE